MLSNINNLPNLPKANLPIMHNFSSIYQKLSLSLLFSHTAYPKYWKIVFQWVIPKTHSLRRSYTLFCNSLPSFQLFVIKWIPSFERFTLILIKIRVLICNSTDPALGNTKLHYFVTTPALLNKSCINLAIITTKSGSYYEAWHNCTAPICKEHWNSSNKHNLYFHIFWQIWSCGASDLPKQKE